LCHHHPPKATIAAASAGATGAVLLMPLCCFPKVTWSSVLIPQECRQNRLLFAYNVRFSLLTPEQEQDMVQQLHQEQQHWLQQQQEQQQQEQQNMETPDQTDSLQSTSGGTPTALSAAARQLCANPGPDHAAAAMHEDAAYGVHHSATSSHRPRGSQRLGYAASRNERQGCAIGPCDAAAGPACVPSNLSQQAALTLSGAGTSGGGGTTFEAVAAAVPGSLDAPSVAMAAAAINGSRIDGNDGSGSTAVAPSSCQLETRSWSIMDACGSVTDHVTGEGVVGLYPLLVPGGDAFAYSSCTLFSVDTSTANTARLVPTTTTTAAATSAEAAGASSSSSPSPQAQGQQDGSRSGQLAGCVLGAMEGSFRFVEGSLMQRTGSGFNARCPRLVFAVPDYVY
jgi:uncharacterized protein affecting Mg2+/Co2+ transport